MIDIRFLKKSESSVTLRVSDGNFSTEYTCASTLALGATLERAVEHFHLMRARQQTADFFGYCNGGQE